MTTIWAQQTSGKWQAYAVAMDSLPMDGLASRPFGLLSFGQRTDRNVALLSPDGVQVWVNGKPVVGGLKVLAHRDEIQFGGNTWYYSSEAPPLLMTFHLAASEKSRPRCGVCRVAINDGDTAVTCPRCGRVYHQLDAAGERPVKHCFTYRDRCLCGHPTALTGEAVWQPDEDEFHV